MLRNKNIVQSEHNVMVPANLNFGEDILQKLLTFKDKICFINGATDERITYGEILQQSMNVAISLAHIGVKKGQIVGILSENRNEFYPAVLGAICAGAVLTTFSPAYAAGELKHVLDISKPKYIFCSPLTYKTHSKTLKSTTFVKTVIIFGEDRVNNTIPYNSLAFPKNINSEKVFDTKTNELLRNIQYEEFQVPDVEGQTETAVILYSSGTTGLPKGVMLTHLNLLSACYQPPSHDPSLLTLTITPWYHAMGLVGTFMGHLTGRTAVYLDKFNPELYLKTIERYKVAQLTVVPPVLVALIKMEFKYDVSSVRIIYSGAAPLSSETVQALRFKFPNASVHQGYGMTEVTVAATRDLYNKPHLSKVGSVGPVTGGTRIKVTDLETGEVLGPNKPGEICVKGPLIMKGYVGISSDNWRDKEGYLRTGDIGYYDEDGCFFIVDRLKELIKYKGFQVPPAEIEAVLLTHPGVKDAGVVAKENREAGEVPLAFIVKQPGRDVTEEELKKFVAEKVSVTFWEGLEDAAAVAKDNREAGEVPLAFIVKQPGRDVTEEELKKYVAEKLSNPKHLRGGVRFVDEIPKSPSGKILRKVMKEMARSGKSKL